MEGTQLVVIKERLHETSGKQRNWGKDEYKENKTDRKRGRKKRQESRLEEQSKDYERGGKKMKGIHSKVRKSKRDWAENKEPASEWDR